MALVLLFVAFETNCDSCVLAFWFDTGDVERVTFMFMVGKLGYEIVFEKLFWGYIGHFFYFFVVREDFRILGFFF
jgi:hypothetical protein